MPTKSNKYLPPPSLHTTTILPPPSLHPDIPAIARNNKSTTRQITNISSNSAIMDDECHPDKTSDPTKSTKYLPPPSLHTTSILPPPSLHPDIPDTYLPAITNLPPGESTNITSYSATMGGECHPDKTSHNSSMQQIGVKPSLLLSDLTEDRILNMKLPVLHKTLAEHGHNSSGCKAELQQKLILEMINAKNENLKKSYLHGGLYQLKSNKPDALVYRCTKYQLGPDGEWTNFRKCKKLQDQLGKKGSTETQYKIHCCPGSLKVPIINGVHGIPFNPLPLHLCGHAPVVCNLNSGERDYRPALEMITPDFNAVDFLTVEKRINIRNKIDKEVQWVGLTGGKVGQQHKRLYCPDLSIHVSIYTQVKHAIAPFINFIQSKYPALQEIKLGAIKSLPGCPSQYSIHGNKLHSDYMKDYNELLPGDRPMSFIIGLDNFNFIYLPQSHLQRKELVSLTVPAGHMILFSNMCLHSGGENNSKHTLIWLFGYVASNAAHFPINNVCKYNWSSRNAKDDMATIIDRYNEVLDQESTEICGTNQKKRKTCVLNNSKKK